MASPSTDFEIFEHRQVAKNSPSLRNVGDSHGDELIGGDAAEIASFK